MRLAIAGGTGVVGRRVVEAATQRGHDAVVLARSTGVDLTSGDGLAGHLAGVDAVIDTTSIRTQQQARAERFFGGVTRHLLKAEETAGVGHHVALSIVGIEEVPLGYYQGKRLQERLISEGRVPWSLLRATQFHEFAGQLLDFMRVGPFSLVPRMLSQPVAAAEVAEVLIDLAESGPAGRAPDLAGPEPLEMVDLCRRVSTAHGLGRRVVPVRMPGAAGRGLRSGALIPADEGPRGSQTFADWLAS
jgi:uncharacterized protein YbjT (DUF2867 family)